MLLLDFESCLCSQALSEVAFSEFFYCIFVHGKIQPFPKFFRQNLCLIVTSYPLSGSVKRNWYNSSIFIVSQHLLILQPFPQQKFLHNIFCFVFKSVNSLRNRCFMHQILFPASNAYFFFGNHGSTPALPFSMAFLIYSSLSFCLHLIYTISTSDRNSS